MHIQLNLERHCIETEIKRRYQQAISSYFKSKKEDDALLQTISIAQQALETLDFRRLRSQHPELDGGSKARVMLSRNDEDQLALTIDSRPIHLGVYHLDGRPIGNE